MNRLHVRLLSFFIVVIFQSTAKADFLNFNNMTVELGPSMSMVPPNGPFENRTIADSLASIIDAPLASSSEFHTQSTHVWVSGGTLELRFDLLQSYNISTVHLWNYYGELYDVDDIDFEFLNSSESIVGSLLNVGPDLGGIGESSTDTTPIFAQDFDVSTISNVRYIDVVISGSNGEVDFNNIGFTGALIPEPKSTSLILAGIAALGVCFLRKRNQKKVDTQKAT